MALTPRDKRMLQVLAVVAALALVYLLVTNVLGGDDGGETAGPTGTTGPGPVEPPEVSPTPRETLPPVVLAGERDPFSIPPELQTTPPGGGVSPTETPPTGTTTPPTGTTTPPTGTTTPPTGTTTPPTTSPPPPPDQIQIGGHDVRLVSIFRNETKLQVEVDGDVYTVEVGAIFADDFRLLEIDGRCARFEFGDDQRFTLCTKIRK